MRAGLEAFFFGLRSAAARPLLILVLHAALLIVLAPLAARLVSDLDVTVAGVPLEPETVARIDAVTWESLAARGHGFVSSFRPAVVGVAAPLGNLERLIGGGWPPLPAALAAALFAALWVLALPVLALAMLGQHPPKRAFAAAVRHFPRLAFLTLLAALAVVPLIVVVLPRLASPVEATAMTSGTGSASTIIRLLAHVVVLALLLSVTVLLDVSRLMTIVFELPVATAVRKAAAVVRNNLGAFLGLAGLYAICWLAGITAYGLADLAWGRDLGYWRVVVMGQLFLLGRLVLRVAYLAGQLRLITNRAPLDVARL